MIAASKYCIATHGVTYLNFFFFSSLGGNTLGRDSCKILAESLASNKTLTHLKYSDLFLFKQFSLFL